MTTVVQEPDKESALGQSAVVAGAPMASQSITLCEIDESIIASAIMIMMTTMMINHVGNIYIFNRSKLRFFHLLLFKPPKL